MEGMSAYPSITSSAGTLGMGSSQCWRNWWGLCVHHG